jgi:hypothetical protein
LIGFPLVFNIILTIIFPETQRIIGQSRIILEILSLVVIEYIDKKIPIYQINNKDRFLSYTGDIKAIFILKPMPFPE